jgi:hypothetical protein
MCSGDIMHCVDFCGKCKFVQMGNGIIKWSTFSPLFGIPICMVDIDP